MALINCPECGRENISDTAEQCPGCGYLVKKHFEEEELKKISERKIQKEIEKKEKKKAKLNMEMENKLKEVDEKPFPTKPSFSTVFSFGDFMMILCFFLGLFGIIMGFVTHSSMWLIFIVFFLIGLLGIWGVCNEYQTAKAQYKEQIADWEGYKNKLKDIIKEDYSFYFDNLEKYGNIFGEEKQSVKNNMVLCSACNKEISKQAEVCPHCGQPTGVHVCPKCKSTNTKVISGASKAVSVATVGVFAANKVKSTYHCNKCGHNF